MINVLLADDHQIVLDGICAFLEKEKNINVVGSVKNGQEVLRILERQPVDIAVLDIHMPELDGIETTRRIRREFPKTRVIILTYSNEGELILNLLRLGAYGYVLKEKSKDALVGAIHAVHNGQRWFPLEILSKAGAALYTPRDAEEEENVHLTDRELEVLSLIADPASPSYREIGDRLHISETTVLTHVRNMKEKLQLNRKEQLLRYAMERGL